MQALYTHLEGPRIRVPPGRFSVQGLNASFQGESSFEKLLKQSGFSQDLKAKEGPPETGSPKAAESDVRTAGKNEAVRNSVHETGSPPPGAGEKGAGETSAPEKGAQAEQAMKPEDSDTKAKAAGKKDFEKTETAVFSPDEKGLSEGTIDGPAIDEKAVAFTGFENLEGGCKTGAECALKEVSEKSNAAQTLVPSDTENDADAESKNALFALPPYASAETASAKPKPKAARHTKAAFGEEVSLNRVSDIEHTGGAEMRLPEIPAISVRDERTQAPVVKEKKHNFADNLRYDGKGNVHADVFFNTSEEPNNAVPSAFFTKEASVSAQGSEQVQNRFASLLSSEIRNNAADLVKAGSIILQDGNKGTINLILHPEELGNVKIRLQFSDNILTGRITVASEEAYNAFKSNITALTEAFSSNGFDTAGFDLSWSGQDGRNTDGRQTDGHNCAANPFGIRYDEQTAFIVEDAAAASEALLDSRPYINLIA
ncbi:flagellar hook-length control protein FliK [Treponema sp. OMZ 840]|uniref:flagellar hook-length control protein FliK n=1 Tax=Treponema sp. OMZ 840 TaxID=244313 RepID=UPI003D92003D